MKFLSQLAKSPQTSLGELEVGDQFVFAADLTDVYHVTEKGDGYSAYKDVNLPLNIGEVNFAAHDVQVISTEI